MRLPEDPVYVLGVLCLLVILSIYAGKTRFGKKLGAALIVIVLTAILANLGWIPSASNSIPLYDGIFTYLAPISIFYLLLGVNLTSIKKAGAPMILLFLLGSLATACGILAAWFILSPERVFGSDGDTLAGMLTGTYTGGSVNFNAIALEYDFQEKGLLYAGTIAVDNVVTTLWIVITLSIPALMRRFWKDKKLAMRESTMDAEKKDTLSMHSLMWLMFIGVAAYFVSEWISVQFPQIPSILTISTIGILLAQVPFVNRLPGSHTLGLYLIYLFLAVIGAYCELSSVVDLQEIGITILLFASLAVFIHGVLIVLLGGLIYRDWDMIAIVSQANIGGGTTAIALAETFGRNELILPAILVGTLGNALGTYLGFLVVYIL
ncbi:Uncharacterized membrane protein [Muriicola jejuensis]|uniref:DUF819 family protein n=1 Tax=Muriicola jejuensis TaxID=504488 RepID=UPI001EF827EE|nr:DUF819 family protein [Muriicola jejuensis]SMP20903.1 Uncharacterized membrane protein [Muriicola jejuensis]